MRLDHLFPIPIVRITVDPAIVESTTALVDQYIESEKLLEADTIAYILLITDSMLPPSMFQRM